MPLNLYELADSRAMERSVDAASIVLKWIAMYSKRHADVYAATLIVSPRIFEGYRRTNIKCDPQKGGVWFSSVTYSYSNQTQEGSEDVPDGDEAKPWGVEYGFDITATQAHITQSLSTVLDRRAGDPAGGPSTAPSYGKAIGVSKDSVAGTDIHVPKFEFTVTGQALQILPSFVRTLQKLVAKTNNAPWKAWEAGEVLYLGCTGQCKPGDVWTLTHRFAVSENLKSGDARLVISPNITLPSKGGWNYVWCSYRDEVNGGALVQVPAAAYVERVYDSGDFTQLRLGK